MKDIGDDPVNTSRLGYFNTTPAPEPLSVPDTLLSLKSNLSERGSEVPTAPTLSVTTKKGVPMMDGSLTSGSNHTDSSQILHTHGASDSTPETSPTSPSCDSSVGSDGRVRGHKARKSLSDSYWVTGPS